MNPIKAVCFLALFLFATVLATEFEHQRYVRRAHPESRSQQGESHQIPSDGRVCDKCPSCVTTPATELLKLRRLLIAHACHRERTMAKPDQRKTLRLLAELKTICHAKNPLYAVAVERFLKPSTENGSYFHDAARVYRYSQP
ncbi:hypothetical protein BV898_19854 [Hypsibius exemplaris]|uniref:Saposin B-type domain-containing protein n=1 Tax=Hypsibius exemplaris TaxID=2072580 RepID=A0A9X6NJT6_HYPEX|nr:hypothetical protein BV898_19854 [Hypsibius exemplaris]